MRETNAAAYVLQACVREVSLGQAAPPFEAGVVMVRVEVWTPPPQVAEHSDQSLHEDTQSHGQGWLWNCE